MSIQLPEAFLDRMERQLGGGFPAFLAAMAEPARPAVTPTDREEMI